MHNVDMIELDELILSNIDYARSTLNSYAY